MTKYKEILRLKSLGFSERSIAQFCNASRNTVSKVVKRANELNVSWPLDDNCTDATLKELLFPKGKTSTNKVMPDFEYIRKELMKNGVTKSLLWAEHVEECKQRGEEPLMYSRFCYHIQQHEQRHHASMHIPRKPAEQVEVDWAGDPAYIINPDTGERDIRCRPPSGSTADAPIWRATSRSASLPLGRRLVRRSMCRINPS